MISPILAPRDQIALSFRVIVLIALVLIGPTIAGAQTSSTGVDPGGSNSDKLATHTIRVDEALKATDKEEWEGEYHWGSLKYVRIILKVSRKGFVFTSYNDMPTEQTKEHFDYGSVRLEQGRIVVDAERKVFGARLFYPIKWAERSLLIPEATMPKLATFYNAGCSEVPDKKELGVQEFPTKREDLNKDLSGKPKLPVEFQSMLLAEPVNGKIVSVDGYKPGESFTLVTLEVDKSERLIAGMRMFGPAPQFGQDVFYNLRVTGVSGRTVHGEILFGGPATDPMAPKTGASFSTKLPPESIRSRPFDCG